jgi:molecular chaperone HscB
MDPFAVLGLPRRFGLDLKAAEARHLELSKTLHPDRYVGAAPNERKLALSRAVEVNEAWRMVRDPIKRAEAILKMEGKQVGETNEPKPPPAFLMEVMEAREDLENAKGDPVMIARVVSRAREQFSEAQRALGEAIDRGAYDEAIPLLGRLRYAARFLDEARLAEDRLAGF